MTDAEREAKYKALEAKPVDTSKHSKIYNALNPTKLYAEEETSKKTLAPIVPGMGRNFSNIQALVQDADLEEEEDEFDPNEDPTVRLERMRLRAQAASREFEKLEAFSERRKSMDLSSLSSPASSGGAADNNPFGANPFGDPTSPASQEEEPEPEFNEEEFMAELARKRQERDAAEAAHQAELRRQHQIKQQIEDEARAKEMAAFKAVAEAERQREQDAKAKVAQEASARLETLSFDFTFGGSAPAAPAASAPPAAEAKKAPPPVSKKPPPKKQ